MAKKPPNGTFGISHTRWATHGKPTDQNAHPHFDATGKLALVHNGVIENYQALKDQLVRDGDRNFASETDTEVLAHLIGKLYEDSIARLQIVVPTATPRRRPSIRKGVLLMPFARLCDKSSGRMESRLFIETFRTSSSAPGAAVRSSSGVGKEENFLASDVSAIVAHTRDAVYLNDFDVVAVERDKFEISSVAGEAGNYQAKQSRIQRRRHQEGRLSALHAQGNL